MISFSKYKVILWDFDGVIMDSMPVRDHGFEQVLASFPKEQVELLMKFHRSNGGLSRYVKFRYFFEQIRNEPITEEQVNEYAQKFSSIMITELINAALLISDTVTFIEGNATNFRMHIVSGSDEQELKFICNQLGLDKYFKSLHGSPANKTLLIQSILEKEKYDKKEMVLVGDSGNDYDAASNHGIDFFGYNSPSLRKHGRGYIECFNPLTFA
jgi:phosphoglycolate phosphatase-like HAD superfamily hydrolase